MTLLDLFSHANVVEAELTHDDREQIRRALAIAQAVDDRVEIERAKNADCRSEGVNWIMHRADELLEGKR